MSPSFSVTDANLMLRLKRWSDSTGTDLTRLNARSIERAISEVGISGLDLHRLAHTASTFSAADHASLVQANRLTGELAAGAQAPTPQADLYGGNPLDRSWFESRLLSARENGWSFKVSIPLWPDPSVADAAVVDALERGKTIVASRWGTYHSPDSSFSERVKTECSFSSVGALREWLGNPAVAKQSGLAGTEEWIGHARQVVKQAYELKMNQRVPAFEALERDGVLTKGADGAFADASGIRYSEFFKGEGEPYGVRAQFPDGSTREYEFGIGR